MARAGSHNLHEENAAHGGTRCLQRFDGLIRQGDGRMEAERGRAGDIVVDRPGEPHHLHAEIFIHRARTP